ncbi:pyruvate, phosphate dikinase [Vulgatibacter sp.]|uniref:pyruvate, phosphate dikinase n=1 Tax=Vulgatibacter sp. TaxID=1971226 RepID=UPI003567FCDA
MDNHVFSFGDGRAQGYEAIPAGNEERKRILGGKGAGLAEMTAAGLPVPPGFTISTGACLLWQREGRLLAAIEAQMDEALALLERRMGKRLGDPANPLLVSVRSGAPKSMPGMMDTILNLGLNDGTVEGLVERTGNARFAYDAWRRFICMFADVVLGLPRRLFEEELHKARRARGVRQDHELDAETLRNKVVPAFLAVVKRGTGNDFPQDAREQLRLAMDAVFRSWNNPRAIDYRRQFHIPDDLGTAVNVQAMVFGNKGDASATGVGFTRDPGSGARLFFGEYLVNAQGEDVVAGIRTPQPIAALEEALPEAFGQLRAITSRLETHYRWPQDFEFTIEEGTLYMLQTRDAKCTARAAIRWAIDFLDAGLISEEEALLRVEPAALDQLLHPVFDHAARSRVKAATSGLPAGPGAATGHAVFTAADAVAYARKGRPAILVRAETSPDDIGGMIAAQGVLTATGGMTSHAAVVGRQLGKPCVVGAGSVEIDEGRRIARIGGATIREGDALSIDGATGEVFLAAIPTVPSEVIRGVQGRLSPEKSEVLRDYLRLMEIADRHRRLEVRANADQPKDAKAAFAFGARGIGLCRTEHMFFEGERIPVVQRMILAAPEGREGIVRLEAAKARCEASKGRGRKGDPRLLAEVRAIEAAHGDAIAAYLGALEELLPLQRADFAGLFEEMDGHPVTIRTLDPPLHEFLPRREELLVAREALRHGKKPEGWSKLEKSLKALGPVLGRKRLSRLELVEAVLHRVDELHEFNPMLGHRGCRLGITYPEITAMQARAIFEAAARCARRGIVVKPEIMIPLVGTVKELAEQKAIVQRVHAEVQAKKRVEIPLVVGTMIEVPRGALTADEIAKEAEFFSFGTNDLTQMTFGYSRDDAGRFIHGYVERQILSHDPFVTLDGGGVGKLVRIAAEGGRATRPEIKLGICGEHGGDPRSIELCHELGLAYVSCSPYRVPVARLAAAQAAVQEKRRAAPVAEDLPAAANDSEAGIPASAIATGPEIAALDIAVLPELPAGDLLRVAEAARGAATNAYPPQALDRELLRGDEGGADEV